MKKALAIGAACVVLFGGFGVSAVTADAARSGQVSGQVR